MGTLRFAHPTNESASAAKRGSSDARGAGFAGPQGGAPRGQERSDWGALFAIAGNDVASALGLIRPLLVIQDLAFALVIGAGDAHSVVQGAQIGLGAAAVL